LGGDGNTRSVTCSSSCYRGLLQITKGICIATRALDGPQLSGRRSGGTSGHRRSLRHALLAALGRVARLLFVVIAGHSWVGHWCALGRRLLLLRWSSVAVVARRRPWGAPRQAGDAVSVEHDG
jgi:hypothetical protein